MKRKVGYFTHPDCALHDCPGHPEHSGRTAMIERFFLKSGLTRELVALTPRPATVDELALNHEPKCVERVRLLRSSEVQWLDGDTYITPDSWQAALLSYGGALLAVEKVTGGQLDRAFCCLRPPGHHAVPSHAMGFCLFNNIAGAARHAQKSCGIERVAIVDFDVHHGNGTQYSFYGENRVHYTSTHQWPFYPGTGGADEIGEGAGEGFTLNLPLSSGTDGATAISLFEPRFVEAMAAFKPQLLLVSAGFDAHIEDPLASLRFRDEDYFAITKIISDVADRYADGRIVSVLEGGYNLQALARSAAQHVKGLLADD